PTSAPAYHGGLAQEVQQRGLQELGPHLKGELERRLLPRRVEGGLREVHVERVALHLREADVRGREAVRGELHAGGKGARLRATVEEGVQRVADALEIRAAEGRRVPG